jgi:hypothetical protein
MIVFEVPELNVVVAGASEEEALRELCADILWLWREYGLANEEELTGDARELKARLLALAGGKG